MTHLATSGNVRLTSFSMSNATSSGSSCACSGTKSIPFGFGLTLQSSLECLVQVAAGGLLAKWRICD